MPASSKKYRPETRLVHAGTLRSQFGETSEALFLTQGYVYPTAEECEARFSGKIPGYVYSRYSNPTMSMFEQRMAAFEDAEAARSTATGMAAVTTAIMGLVRAGDHVVAAKALFGSCRWVIEEWLPRFGVTSTLVNGTDLDAWKKATQKNTKAFFLESPTNPTLEVIDIAAVAGAIDLRAIACGEDRGLGPARQGLAQRPKRGLDLVDGIGEAAAQIERRRRVVDT